jgi:hypothetical protein
MARGASGVSVVTIEAVVRLLGIDCFEFNNQPCPQGSSYLRLPAWRVSFRGSDFLRASRYPSRFDFSSCRVSPVTLQKDDKVFL